MAKRTVQILIRVPEEVRRELKIEGAQRNMTMSMIVLEALRTRTILVKHPQPKEPPA